MNSWGRSSLSRRESIDDEGSSKLDEVDPLENYLSNLTKKKRELEGFLELAKERKQDAMKHVEVTREKIVQTANDIQEAVERDKVKLLQETDMFAAAMRMEIEKTEMELHGSIRANEESLTWLEQLRARKPEEQAELLLEFRSRQKELDAAKHDLTAGTLKFKRSEKVKGNVIGEVRLGDIDSSDPYVDTPVEIGIIEGEKTIAGVTVLNKKIYILRDFLPNVEVYNVGDLSRHKMMKLEGLRKPSDVASDPNLNFLYISDAAGSVYKLEPENAILTKFPADVGGEPHGICVIPTRASNGGNVLVTCSDTRQVREFTSEGVLVRSIRFQSDLASPWHLVPLFSSWWCSSQDDLVIKKYAVCHGWESSKLHRVCWLDANGKTIKTFGSSNGSGSGKVDVPFRMAVDPFGYLLVADRNNNRIILLSPNLVYVRDLIGRSSNIKQPRRIHLDIATNQLYVGLIDGTVRVFQLVDV